MEIRFKYLDNTYYLTKGDYVLHIHAKLSYKWYGYEYSSWSFKDRPYNELFKRNYLTLFIHSAALWPPKFCLNDYEDSLSPSNDEIELQIPLNEVIGEEFITTRNIYNVLE